MMALKARMCKKSEQLFQSTQPQNKKQCFQVLYDMFRTNDHEIRKQYDIWNTLNTAAQGYSTADSRKVAVDLEELNLMQDFESLQRQHSNSARFVQFGLSVAHSRLHFGVLVTRNVCSTLSIGAR